MFDCVSLVIVHLLCANESFDFDVHKVNCDTL